MKIDWRVSAIVGGGAFFLSVLTGVIGGVAFGTLILRGLIVAALFAIGGIGATVLIDRFLPDLRRSSAPSADSESGNSVDIVVEGDDEYDIATDDRGQNDDDFGSLDANSEDRAATFSGDDEEELLEEVDGSEELEDDSGDQAGDETGEIEVETLGDELPNVDSMSDSFTEVPLGEEPDTEVSKSGIDPVLMAKAIRTVLKREE